ncbi:LysM peptidoglycan-binding domain-containing protein, partial [Weizmannia sp. CD-2023]|uniref:LysM peptidoglycan-binding domain-containing protein n=1 Tax=Weizmannia sp. CD-2023 TaxID=3037263 RepID=UPI002E215ED6|nr:LysM peptidoglycan-binding domain-containing protein [Weizmannia sp. CD-2023]
MEIYTVQQGDTLWRIANRLDADLAQLFLANGLTASSPLVPGQALVIPDRFFQYIVQEGDQLGTIAARLGVLAQALINANQLRNPASLFPGQVLFIPYRNHTVKQGETLYGIVRTYGADMGAIMQANRLPGTALSAGQVLRIPAPRRPVKEVNAYTTGFGAAGTAEVYQLGPYFTYLSPFRHTFREDGSLTPLNDRSVLQAAEANGVLPLLILANFTSEGFSSDLAARLLRNEALQETLISNLLATIRQKGYRGVNFDFEYVYPEDRDRYTAFLRRVARRFRPEGLLVSTALAPKISGTQPGLLYEAHDYGAHGAIVDFAILMTY